MTEIDLDRIEQAAKAAYEHLPYREGTAWHWSGNVEGFPHLELSAWVSGHGRCSAMDFTRWGMQGAGPRFIDERMMMQDARELATFEVGRRGIVGVRAAKIDGSVYRFDVDGIEHPIARHIVTADPQTVLALVALIREAEAERAEAATLAGKLAAEIRKGIAACDRCEHDGCGDLADYWRGRAETAESELAALTTPTDELSGWKDN